MIVIDLIVAGILFIFFIIGFIYLANKIMPNDINDMFDDPATFVEFIFPIIVLITGLGIVFVIAHFAIKYW